MESVIPDSVVALILFFLLTGAWAGLLIAAFNFQRGINLVFAAQEWLDKKSKTLSSGGWIAAYVIRPSLLVPRAVGRLSLGIGSRRVAVAVWSILVAVAASLVIMVLMGILVGIWVSLKKIWIALVVLLLFVGFVRVVANEFGLGISLGASRRSRSRAEGVPSPRMPRGGGTSHEREGILGKYTEHTDERGDKIGESRKREGVFGTYTEHTDERGDKIGESRERESVFGTYTEHADERGDKIGESREREGLFGTYTDHKEND